MPRKPPRSTEERLVRAQKSMMPGTLGGRVASAAPMSLDVSRLDPRLRRTTPQPKLNTYTRTGSIAVASSGAVPLPNDSGSPLSIISVRASLGTPPGAQPVIIDLLIDGTSIFDGITQPQIDIGDNVGAPVTPAVNQWPVGGALTIDVLQGDSSAADLHVTIATS